MQNPNSHRENVEFYVGDVVWLSNLSAIAMGKRRGRKLAPRGEGPYRIIQHRPSLIYDLQHTVKNSVLKNIHVEHSELFYPAFDSSADL